MIIYGWKYGTNSTLHKFKKRPNTTDKRPSKRRMQKLLSSDLTHDESLL